MDPVLRLISSNGELFDENPDQSSSQNPPSTHPPQPLDTDSIPTRLATYYRCIRSVVTVPNSIHKQQICTSSPPTKFLLHSSSPKIRSAAEQGVEVLPGILPNPGRRKYRHSSPVSTARHSQPEALEHRPDQGRTATTSQQANHISAVSGHRATTASKS